MPADLEFTVQASWSGTGREGHGAIASGGQSIRYSDPSTMGGKGTGTSPEELFVAAVGACYSGTVPSDLRKTTQG